DYSCSSYAGSGTYIF
nr:immunoglobulin light chain junction region [Macaca mulatta]MOV95971.1 immunoglobulin light chain junction region [Macaca mulatta]MOV97433.1 immunoglobulin light chain junction region [Macaca mulatta]MOV98547.1 immunoglobulin light chain junction region [Macaca mulatta]MOV98899.1 immunoglobulin light chain junction region [Macaca mulatta]